MALCLVTFSIGTGAGGMASSVCCVGDGVIAAGGVCGGANGVGWTEDGWTATREK